MRTLLMITVLAAGLAACAPATRPYAPFTQFASDWDQYQQWDDDKVLRVYFLVKPERERVVSILDTWDENLHHEENKPWHRRYLAWLTSAQKKLKFEMIRRQLTKA